MTNIFRTIRRGFSRIPFFLNPNKLRQVRPIKFMGFLRMPIAPGFGNLGGVKMSIDVRGEVSSGINTYWTIRHVQSEIKGQLLDNAKEKE